MNPNIADLIKKVLGGEIELQDYYVAMSQMGFKPTEAETMLSEAQPRQDGLDPTLSIAQEVLSSPDRSSLETASRMNPEQPRPAGIPTPSIPMTQEERVLQRPTFDYNEPERRSNPLANPQLSPPEPFGARTIRSAREALSGLMRPSDAGAGSATPSYSTPGATAGSMIGAQAAPAQAAPAQAPAAAPQPQAPMGNLPTFAMGLPEGMSQFPSAPSAPTSTARQVLNAARQAPAQTQQPVPEPQRRVDVLGTTGGEQQGGSALSRLLSGDFREGADQRIAEAMRRQREESGVDESRATGGQVQAKKSNRDDVLHKALDIIHAMLTRR